MEVYKTLLSNAAEICLEKRFNLDRELFKAAKKSGYDAIALVSEIGIRKIKEQSRLPRSVELNIFDIKKSSLRDRNA